MEHKQPVVDREEIARKYAIIKEMAITLKAPEGPAKSETASIICSIEAKETDHAGDKDILKVNST